MGRMRERKYGFGVWKEHPLNPKELSEATVNW